MKMKKLGFLVFAATVAGQALAVDVTTFDIGGVKLGMNPAEAKAALQAKCVRDHGKFDVTTVLADNPYVRGKSYPQYMHCVATGSETTVSMLAIPPGAVVVNRINYKMPWSEENEKALKAGALGKYGEPTNIIQMDSAPEWCNDPQPTWKGGPACNGTPGPSLRVVRSELILLDPRYQQQVWDDRKKKETVKPSL